MKIRVRGDRNTLFRSDYVRIFARDVGSILPSKRPVDFAFMRLAHSILLLASIMSPDVRAAQGNLTEARAPDAIAQYVIHVSVDGLSGPALREMLRNESDRARIPALARLFDEGAGTFNARTDYTHTNTLPNHLAMLTGLPVLAAIDEPELPFHGWIGNDTPMPEATLHDRIEASHPFLDSVFTVAHANGRSTALFASKEKFVLFAQSYGVRDSLDWNRSPTAIDMIVLRSDGDPPDAHELNADFLRAMREHHFAYTFLHYRDPDTIGHALGWESTEYRSAIARVDSYLQDIFALIETDSALAHQTAIILTSDHGGIELNHGDATLPANYTIPLVAWGTCIAHGANLYTINETTRGDPGDARPDHRAQLQPIRNGDSGNLALMLLGLDAIPGSLINAKQDLRVRPLCPADLSGDDAIAFDDLALLIEAWGECKKESCAADIDRDGEVTADDLALLVVDWGLCE